MRLRFSALALFGLSAACQSYPFSFQTNERIDARNYQVKVATSSKTDVLFVIDNSGSMASKQARLKQQVASFITTLTSSVDDYQVGVITTDVFKEPGPSCDPCCDLDTDGDGVPDFSNCDAGRLIAFDGKSRILKRPAFTEDQDQLNAENDLLVQQFNATITAAGTNGNATELPFQAMREALDPEGPFAVRALNFGFLRNDADLAIIFLSDEDDCSHNASFFDSNPDDSVCYGKVGGGGSDADSIPIDDYLDFLADVKGGVEHVRAAGVFGTIAVDKDNAAQVAAYPLGFRPVGCVTDAVTNDASAECGCWDQRFLPDRDSSDTPVNEENDFYCNFIAGPPFDQLNTRTPSFGNDQGGCNTMPGSRYSEFLEGLNARRNTQGLQPGVLEDSICQGDYAQTLQDIITKIILSNCLQLVDAPAGAVDENGDPVANVSDLDLTSVVLYRNGEIVNQVPKDSKDPGWYYDAKKNAICLEGGLIERVGDIYTMSVISGSKGFDDQE